MREMLFKAKSKDDEKWVEGYYVKLIWPAEDFHGIIPENTIMFSDNTVDVIFEIDPETLCQYTGLRDKNGGRIWENDIIRHERSDTVGTVKWYQEDYVGWCVNDVVIDEQQFTDEMWGECEVIGNFFDNPELLEEK